MVRDAMTGDRLIGMAQGRVVFDGAPAALTDHVARELYDLEADVRYHEGAGHVAVVPLRRAGTGR